MRITFILMLIASLYVSANVTAQSKVSMSVKDEDLSKVLALVEKQTGYVFFFDEKLLSIAKPVTITARDLPLLKFLDLLFQQQPLKYSLRNTSVTLSIKAPVTPRNDLVLQENNIDNTLVIIKGIIAGADGKMLPGVSVRLKPSTIGTTTNEDGIFVLQNVPPGTYTLEISSIGYSTISRKLIVTDKPFELAFTLQQEAIEQKEVVISTGYGVKKPGELTGAVQKISGDEIRRGITSSDPASLLKGRAAGLYISEQNAADPTSSGGQIFVRGQSSIAGVGVDQINEFVVPALNYGPLIVLDGVIMPNQNLKELVTPQEIQDIIILKDAAATAIYGSRAAAGVLVVTTKRGSNAKTRINADVKYGINQPNQGRIKYLNGEELFDLQKRFYTEDYSQNNASLSSMFPTLDNYLAYRLPTQEQVNNSYDWAKYAFITSHTTEVNLSASGGNDRTRYYMGGSYYNEQATGVLNSLIRKTFRLNLESRLTDKVTATISINGIMNDGRRDQGNTVDNIQSLIPWANPYAANGAVSQALNFKMGGMQQIVDNPLFSRQYNFSKRQSQLFFGSFKLDYKITDWLNISSTNSGNLNYNKNTQYTDVRTYNGGSSFFAPQGFLGTITDNLMSYLTSNQLTFNKNVGKHMFRALAGMEFGQTTVEDMLVNVNHVRAGYPVISLGREIGGAADLSIFGIPTTKAGNIEGGKDIKAIYSWFGEAGYTYKGRYSLSASVRRDASSSFGRDNRYGTFYSGGGAWIASNEEFLQHVKWISYLKLRANYGTSGSQLGDNFLTRTLYDPRYTYSGAGAATISVLGNPNLRWEVTKSWNAGVDMEFFKRFTAAVDVYKRRSQDLLQKVLLPALSGFPTQWQNAATVENKGIEIVLNSQNINKSNFSWSTSFNISFNRNKIVKVANDSLRQGYFPQNSYYLFKGDDINALKAVKYAGVDPQSGKPRFEKLIFDDKGNKIGVEYVNTIAEVDAASDNRQFQTIGSSQPRFYGGITNNFTYKQFSLSVLITFALKYTIIDNYTASFQVSNLDRYNQLAYTKNQIPWTTPGQTNATEPELYYQVTTDYFGSSKYMYDASNASLRNVRLSYDLPQSLINRMKLSNFTVYASGDNLYTLYNKHIVTSGPEGPSVGEAQNFGNAAGPLSIPRRYVFGLQLTF
ncbi:TonB-linked outer membrane protein, SusC/RagA family [Chitinophaga sp. CF118]|uniref:SusC/RagA family TonB-linked outer membrane protein n=1 Tax=Chitinophaga sp. CF118 TaxID=1884367 RepID=UPI0008E7F8B0|nr:SusC/RagA family TonB-linked outer membrane protein [Chitinophaga sp. CF118]SFD22693.1 TonB-linked outer membrane protein, SusC/RagA family [Chitinophaga sp. CF118]